MKTDHVRIGRLNDGASHLDSHQGYEARTVIGSTVPGSVRIENGLGISTIRLTDAEDVKSTVVKVADGSMRGISIGYSKLAPPVITTGADGIEIRTYEDWEPYETSSVPVQADAIAQTRTMERTPAQETETMPSTITQAAPAIDLNSIRAEATRNERKRTADITSAARALGFADDAQAFIDSDSNINDVRAALIAKRAAADEATATTNTIRAPQRGMVMSRDFDGNIRALGGHTTADFPLLLANVANKSLLPGYEAEPLNFEPFVTDRNLPDFKQASVVNLGRITAMTAKAEGAEYNNVTIGESSEVYSLATYGSTIGFSREAMINDDLSGLQIAIREMGAVWARTQLDLFWAIITANANMGDGVALFATATHANLGTTAALSKTTLAELRKLLRKQRGVESSSGAADGQILNLRPTHLIVPAALEETAENLLGMEYNPTPASSASAVCSAATPTRTSTAWTSGRPTR